MMNKDKPMTLERFEVQSDDARADHQRSMQALTRQLAKMAPYDGAFELISGGVKVFRSSKTGPEKIHLLAQPSICIVPQGAKVVSIGQSGLEYVEDANTMVVYAAEVPINIKVTEASPQAPYFCLMLPLQSEQLNKLTMRVFPRGVPKSQNVRSVYVGENNQKILESALRLLELIEHQDLTELLAPLVVDEILIRLLYSTVGPAIAQVGIADSHTEKVAKAISWLKNNYAEPIKMEELARLTGMSVSSFHSHFKSITAMSPLQFQKTVRLQEARTLIRTRMMDVSSAAFAVGYSSSSQFSREYTRAFGVPPSKDMVAIGQRH